ncbi:FAD-dependent oxidoreductase [Microbacterium sp. KUDC0406]|nr:FAD-dependent oxidoreductase [Microbacterium sp. KUDC0406]UJP11709.1 FAD-dependent oxidoreductase [Microbacterium sp. KUDC0406]
MGIIGGGIVGVALARELAQRGDDVVVLEKESRLARHQTGRNSGVVHAGLYYAPGSLKAELCAQGRTLIRDYCAEKGLPYHEVGKLVVAVDESELPALAEIERRSIANGVPDLARIDGIERLREIEPHATGVAAVHSPTPPSWTTRPSPTPWRRTCGPQAAASDCRARSPASVASPEGCA